MAEPRLTTVPRDLYYHEVAYVRALEAALAPFSRMAGELFARNKNEGDVLIAFDNPDDPHRITAGDFFNARRALTST